MQIRPAKPSDAAGIAGVVLAMNELRSGAQQPHEITAQTIAANLQRVEATGGSTAYVAELPDETIIGYAAVHWVPFLFLPGGEAYVTEVFVRPSDSARGVGSSLLTTIVTEARRRGCARVSLLNGRDGESYRRKFYGKRGWMERPGMANFVFPLTKEPNQTAEPTDALTNPAAAGEGRRE